MFKINLNWIDFLNLKLIFIVKSEWGGGGGSTLEKQEKSILKTDYVDV